MRGLRWRCVPQACFLAGALLASGSAIAAAEERGFELGGTFSTSRLAELDQTDFGLGARIGYRLNESIALEAELHVFPGELGETPFSSRRLEGLFGIRAGFRAERSGFYGKLRPGFLRFAEAPEPVACILIFPPPLSCTLAEGETVLAVDLGAVLELYPSRRTIVRFDAGDQLLRFHGPALGPEGPIADASFISHNLRVTFGLGFRF